MDNLGVSLVTECSATLALKALWKSEVKLLMT